MDEKPNKNDTPPRVETASDALAEWQDQQILDRMWMEIVLKGLEPGEWRRPLVEQIVESRRKR